MSMGIIVSLDTGAEVAPEHQKWHNLWAGQQLWTVSENKVFLWVRKWAAIRILL